MGGELYNCKDPAVWRSVFALYSDVVEEKTTTSKGRKAGKLAALDKWYQEELPRAVSGRTEKYLTHAELVQLMEWKLTISETHICNCAKAIEHVTIPGVRSLESIQRGKFRPTLQQMVRSNSSDAVEACTRRAFKLLPDISAAIAEISKLKAVGPATASAVLVAGAPQLSAFMADEAVESIPGLVPIKYTLKHYILYLDKVRECAKRLNKNDLVKDWTPHRIEQCLWTWAVAGQIKPLLLKGIVLHQSKTVDKEKSAAPRPVKRQKTQ